MKVEELAAVVDELIEVLHLQARKLESLVADIERVTTRLPEESEMAVIRSSLTGLHQKVKKLRGEHRPSM
jgi:polyhydroxyalkanoate synthesis regulator phasin